MFRSIGVLGWLRPFRIVQTAGQIFGLALFSWGADRIAAQLGIPLPGSIIGLFVILLLLHLGVLPLRCVKAGADWLVSELLLFFIPAVVAVVPYSSQLRVVAWQLVVVIVASTAFVMLGTALTVDWGHNAVRGIRLRTIRRERADRAS